MKEKKAIEIKLVLPTDAKILYKFYAHHWDRPPQDIVVEPSMENADTLPAGRKCGHGVYIPANSQDPNRAAYCTLCQPYFILAKKHAAYVA